MNNIARWLQALAAVLGGTQSLHTDSYDEALALPNEDAARIALRTQQIIAYESEVAQTVDPLGGSYFLERLTLDMEEGAFDYFARMDAMGGMVKAIERDIRRRRSLRPATSTRGPSRRKERNHRRGKRVCDSGRITEDSLTLTTRWHSGSQRSFVKLRARRSMKK